MRSGGCRKVEEMRWSRMEEGERYDEVEDV